MKDRLYNYINHLCVDIKNNFVMYDTEIPTIKRDMIRISAMICVSYPNEINDFYVMINEIDDYVYHLKMISINYDDAHASKEEMVNILNINKKIILKLRAIQTKMNELDNIDDDDELY